MLFIKNFSTIFWWKYYVILAIHFVCAKLFVVLNVSDIFYPPIFYFVFVTGRSQLHYTKSELLFQLIGKPPPNHATIAVFFLRNSEKPNYVIQ